MKIVKTLDPIFCLNLIDKHKNILKEESEKRESYFKNIICVQCKSDSITYHPLFIEGKPVFDGCLPKQIGKCNDCNCEFEPYTKLITKL